MKDKYYTPEIEEFHVGFEYEVNYGKDRWVKEGLHYAPQVVTLPYKNLENIRVKHLDREDIESLGFGKINDIHGGIHPSYDRFLLFNVKKYNNYIILYNYTDQWLTVHIEGSSDDIRFYGLIKNKSELKRLLKQLGI